MGPWVGWINGWAIFVADVIVMASLAVIASTYTYLLFGWTHGAQARRSGILVGSTVWIALMTWICWRGIELSARVQQFLLAAEILILAAFAVVALVKVYANDAGRTPCTSSADWFNPFALGFKPLVDGMLLGIFIYWGWDSGVAVNEETESSRRGARPRRGRLDADPARDLPRRLRRGAGVRRHGVPDRTTRTTS